MAIFSDAAGFKYMGDCQWGTLNINYPAQTILQAHSHSSASAELTSLCSSSGLSYRNIATQTQLNNLTYVILLFFGATGDINDRYTFNVGNWTELNAFNAGLRVFNNSGCLETSNVGFDTTNQIYYLGSSVNSLSGGTGVFLYGASGSTVQEIQWVGASDGNYLALFLSQRSFAANAVRTCFMYAGKPANINTEYNYYNASNTTNGITIANYGAAAVSNASAGGHYIASAGKNLLQTGDATYTIACADGQTPGSQWATDFYAFDNNSTLGFPAIGRVRGMLLGIGSYTLGKPVKIIGSVFPDGGSPWYVPVGSFAEKTLLMRCYSSMT